MAVAQFLRLMGVPEADVPATPERRWEMLHRSARWRSGVAVMVDAPRSITEALPFLATSPGSLTVVTGSHRFDLRTLGREDLRRIRHVDWEDVTLQGLSDADATTMFLQQAKIAVDGERDRVRVADFVSAARGNPGLIADYAFDVVTERLLRTGDPLAAAHRHTFGAAAVPGHQPRDRADFAGLTGDRRALAVLLAQHPDSDFGVDLAVSLLGPGTDPVEVRARLDVLVERGVLVRGAGEGPPRYRFPTRSMRSTFLPDPEQAGDTPERVLAHYYAIAYAAHRRLMPGRWLQRDLDGWSAFPDGARAARSFATVEEARRALSVERRTLVRVVLDAVETGRHAMAAELCEVLWASWFLSGSFADVVDAQAPLVRATEGTHRLEPARLHVQTAIAYRRDRNGAEARREAALALELAEDAHPLVRLTALDALADVEADEGRYDAASGHFAAATRIAEGMDPVDPRALHIMVRKEGLAHLGAGRLPEAERLILRALGLLPEDDHQNRARTHKALADLRVYQGRLDEALEEYDGAVASHRLLGDQRRVGDVYVARADAVADRDPDAARAELGRALEAYEAAEAVREAAEVRARIGA
ncbi:tetratricopeptide repeat protein [Nocardiopsis eucommiae]|uniref:Tetratricopeptide repeat protein n=1 Tax=Nocardiopsis eucommiae TaxID=2831970 RepID=A0A975L839_9ACTN|nr:tetratricopeptide repeat protein [Nocardiopsis eucommiae]